MIGIVTEVKHLDSFELVLTQIPTPIGSSGTDVVGASNNALSDETDHILALLQKYPVNATVAEVNIPLTEGELLRTSNLSSLSIFYSHDRSRWL
jgi:hypothetical protein